MKDVRTAEDLRRAVVRSGMARVRPSSTITAELSERFSNIAKLSELGRLAFGIIHEINNPIASLRSNVSILLQSLPDLFDRVRRAERPLRGSAESNGGQPLLGDQDADNLVRDLKELVKDISLAVDILMSISGGLRPLAQSDHGAPVKTDVHQCIEAALRIAAYELRHRVRVEKDFGRIPELASVPGGLVQVFLNLFVNAAQAIDGDGVLGIRTRIEGAKEARSSRSTASRRVVIEVRDSGRGILPEDLGKIFRPFFTTKPPPMGLGLGLSVSKRIVERQGGGIAVSSSPGKGTVFRIELPLETAGMPWATSVDVNSDSEAMPPQAIAGTRKSKGREAGRDLVSLAVPKRRVRAAGKEISAAGDRLTPKSKPSAWPAGCDAPHPDGGRHGT